MFLGFTTGSPAVADFAPSGDAAPAAVARRQVLARLAERIGRLRPGQGGPAPRCSSGIAALDAALGGGFALAAVHELLAPGGDAAAHTVAILTATRAVAGRRWIFLLDTAGDFYPPAAAQLGLPLERLVVIRVQRPADALWVAEQALRCRFVGAVLVALREMDGRQSRRLQLAAEAGGGLGLVLLSAASGATFAASRVQFDALPGVRESRRVRVSVLKVREGSPAAPFVLELADEPGVVPAAAEPVDGSGAAQRRAAAG